MCQRALLIPRSLCGTQPTAALSVMTGGAQGRTRGAQREHRVEGRTASIFCFIRLYIYFSSSDQPRKKRKAKRHRGHPSWEGKVILSAMSPVFLTVKCSTVAAFSLALSPGSYGVKWGVMGPICKKKKIKHQGRWYG